MDHLIRRLQERIQWSPAVEMDAFCGRTSESGEELPPRPPRPAVPLAAVDAFEQEFGFRLPALVRRLYTEVADGGYGPAWGINRLWSPPGTDFERWWDVPMSIETWYRLYRQEREKNQPPEFWQYWPNPSIRLCEVGCNISICVDCTTDEGRLFKDDPMVGSDGRESIIPIPDLLAEWLSKWLDQPWPEQRY